MAKFDPTLLNRTWEISPPESTEKPDKCHVQWYPGVGSYYVCIEHSNGERSQVAWSKAQLKKFLKNYAVNLTSEEKQILGIKEDK